MSTIIPLGKLAGDDAGRDAIHIAVAPVIAGARLSPGQHIGINEGGKASAAAQFIGIVDPYLKQNVEAGERFYLCLYPNTITSLRHHWVHPAFKDEGPAMKADFDKDDSEAWLREYAKRVNPYCAEGGHYFEKDGRDTSYECLIEDLKEGCITYRGTDMHGRGDLEDAENLAHHASIVLGRTINFDGGGWAFSCSC